MRLAGKLEGDAQERAGALFRRAIAIDPTIARAHTGLAFNHLNRDTRAHVDWLVDRANLRRPEDAATLRDGLGASARRLDAAGEDTGRYPVRLG